MQISRTILKNIEFIYEDGSKYRFSLDKITSRKVKLYVYKYQILSFKIYKKQFTYRYYKKLNPGGLEGEMRIYSTNLIYNIKNDCSEIIKAYNKSLITPIAQMKQDISNFDGFVGQVSDDLKKRHMRTSTITNIIK